MEEPGRWRRKVTKRGGVERPVERNLVNRPLKWVVAQEIAPTESRKQPLDLSKGSSSRTQTTQQSVLYLRPARYVYTVPLCEGFAVTEKGYLSGFSNESQTVQNSLADRDGSGNFSMEALSRASVVCEELRITNRCPRRIMLENSRLLSHRGLDSQHRYTYPSRRFCSFALSKCQVLPVPIPVVHLSDGIPT